MRERRIFGRTIKSLPGRGSESSFLSDRYFGEVLEQEFSFENEIDAKFGKTLYFPIQLSKKILPKIGVFIPLGFQPVTAIKNARPFSAIDIIVFLHGHIYPCDNNGVSKFDKGGIEYYWNTPGFMFLREELASSGRNALLIAPTFTNKLNRNSNSFGHLDENAKFDFLLNECLSNLKNINLIPKDSEPRHIVLAGHSAGGLPMQSILWAKNSLGRNIVECWGFECLYFGTDSFWCWLNHNADKDFVHYRRNSMFKKQTEQLKKQSNFRDVNDGKGHCSIVKEKWRKAIESCRWLLPRKPSGNAQKSEVGDFSRNPTHQEISHPFRTTSYQKHRETEFSVEEVELFKGKIVVAGLPSNKKTREKAKKSGGPYVEVKESPSVFLLEIIRKARAKALIDKKNDIAAKLDPDEWFKGFTRDFTFLGRALKVNKRGKGKSARVEYQYVHLEMAKMLKAAENEFVKKLGVGDAKKTGDILLKNSDEGISGSRLTSSTATFSMHMFGLAVDVNYRGNPFIEQGDIKPVNNVLENAALLMNQEKLSYQNNVKGRFADRFEYVQILDDVIENYFKLLDNPAELERYLKTSKSDIWRKLSAAEAKKKIQKNLDNLAGYLARREMKDYFKKHAILDFDKRFVVGMEAMNFDWGGWYGDMMHFDMRKTGVGFYIEKARKEYSAQVRAQAQRLLSEKKYGEHSPSTA